MGMKIALLLPVPRSAGNWELEQTAKSALEIVNTIKNSDTDIMPCFPEKGVISPLEHCYRYLVYRADREMYEAALDIEQDGYDALMLSCWTDPALMQMRQALNIPVVGPAQTAMLFANTMGDKFSIITQNSVIIPQILEAVERYGLKNKLASIRPITLADEEHLKALVDARPLISDFQQVVKKCITDGAEVILVGCMLMAIALSTSPGCKNEFPGGVKEVEGVPIVDNLAVMVKVAETMVALKQSGHPWISRKMTFAQASKEVEKRAKSDFPDTGKSYFTLPM